VTWWGHATLTVEDAGTRVLTDPVLLDRVGHLYRRGGPSPGRPAREADVVLLSHLHADHLHLPSLRLLARGTRIIAPRGAGGLLHRLRHFEVTEVEPGDLVRVGEVGVSAVPARHDGRRYPGSRLSGPALGFLVDGRLRTYFAGDTELFAGMADVECDVALLPVGGWGPTLGAGHLDPEEAARALTMLRPAVAVPMHYGTFWPVGLARMRRALFFGPAERFAAAALHFAPQVDVRVLRHGQTTLV
jgi:L-ascorbate metabolism protein UlaG (beta-lactamase superfamily)